MIELARITLVRLMRGRAVWASLAIALAPAAFASMAHGRVDQLLLYEQMLLAILPAMFVASSLAEELEDRTATYLWSRPLPRGAVLAGKLLALVPVVVALALASWVASASVGDAPITASSLIGLAAGAVTASMVAAALAMLAPRQGMALTIFYLLFADLPIGELPQSLRVLSLSYQTRVVCGGELSAIAPLLLIAAIAGGIAWWRMRRLEV